MLPRQPKVSGWSPGRLQLSLFIRDYLADGKESWAHAIYGAYALAVLETPLHRGRGRRKVISYHGFLNYMYMLRKLGLIEYVLEDGEIKTDEALDKGGNPAPLAKRQYIRAVMDRLGDPAWHNLHRALYG